MTQVLKKTVAFAIIAFLLAFLANLIINNPYTHRLIRGALAEKLLEITPLEVDFEAMSLSLLPLEVIFYGVQVKAESQWPGPDLLKISHIKVNLSWWNLIIGRNRISSIHLHDLAANWPPPWDFQGFLKDSPSSDKEAGMRHDAWPPADIPVDEISVTNARIKGAFILREKIPEPLSQLYLDMAGLDLNIRFKSWKDLAVSFNSPKSQLYIDKDQILTNTGLAGDLTLAGQDIRGTNILVTSQDTSLKGALKGRLNLQENILSSIRLDSQWRGYSDLSILGAWLGIEDTKGRIRADITPELHVPVHDSSDAIFQISGHADLEDGVLGGFRLFDSGTDFVINQDRMIFRKTEIRQNQTVFGTASGSLSFQDPLPYDFNLYLADLPLNQLLSIFSQSLPQLNFSLESPGGVSIKGQGFPFSMIVAGKAELSKFDLPEIHFEKKSYAHSPQCSMNLEIGIDTERLTFHKGSGQCRPAPLTDNARSQGQKHLSQGSEVNLRGSIGFEELEGINLLISSPAFSADLGSYFLQSPVQGSGSISTTIKGPYGGVKTSGSFRGEKLSVKKIPLGKVSGDFSFQEDLFRWKNLSIKPESGGEISSEHGGLYPATFDLSETSMSARNLTEGFVSDFLGNLLPHLDTTFTLKQSRLFWKGPFLVPAHGQGTFSLEGKNLQAAGEPLADEFSVTLHADAEKLVLEPASALYKGLRAGARVEITKQKKPGYGPAPASTIWWQMIGLSPEDIILATFRSFPQEEKLETSVKIPWFEKYLDTIRFSSGFSFQGQLEGTLATIQGHFKGEFSSITLNGAQMPPATFSGFLDKGALSINLSHSGSSLEGRFAVNLLQDHLPYDWYFSFRRFDVRALGTELFYADPRNFAYLTGSWTMKGHLLRWWDSRGRFDLSDLTAGYTHDSDGITRRLSLRNKKEASLLFAGSGWAFAADEPLELEGDYFNLKLGMKKNKPPHLLNFFLESDIDSGAFTLFSNHIEGARGDFHINASLKGPAHDLRLTGRMFTPDSEDKNAGLRLSVPDLRPEFRNLEFDVHYQDGYLDIKKLSAIKGTGTLSAMGQFRLMESSPARTNVNLSMDQIKVIYPVPYLKSFDTILSGDLQISGSERPYLISGDVSIDKARSTRRFDLREEVVNVIRQDTLDQAQKSFSDNPYLQLNVNFLASKSVTIHNSSMQLTLSTDLRLHGDEDKQVVMGHVDIERGKFIYKKEFVIQRGEITFENPAGIDPRLDIVAVATVSPYKITVALSGPASRPVVELLVDPPTRDDGTVISRLEAILLLTRGSLPRQERKSAEATGLGISEVLNVYASQVPFDILSERFGQDLIHVYPDVTTDDSGSPVLQLNVPIKIYNDIEAVYRLTQDKSEISVEVPVHNNISLSGSYDNTKKSEEVTDSNANRDGSVDLKFRFPVK